MTKRQPPKKKKFNTLFIAQMRAIVKKMRKRKNFIYLFSERYDTVDSEKFCITEVTRKKDHVLNSEWHEIAEGSEW